MTISRWLNKKTAEIPRFTSQISQSAYLTTPNSFVIKHLLNQRDLVKTFMLTTKCHSCSECDHGANSTGYVIRNGVSTAIPFGKIWPAGDLAIYKDGSFSKLSTKMRFCDHLVKDGVVNLLAFGPSCWKWRNYCWYQFRRLGKFMASNPRTAIGITDETTTLSCCDGRTSESEVAFFSSTTSGSR